MRHPVSTSGRSGGHGQASCAVVEFTIVGSSIHPAAPKDAEPSAGEDAYRVGVIAAACTGSFVDAIRPRGRAAGVIGPADESLPKAFVAGPPEYNATVLSGLVSYRCHACLCGEMVVAREARTVIADFGKDLPCVDTSNAGKGGDHRPVRVLGDRVFNGGGELLELDHHGFQGGHEASDDVSLRFHFELTGVRDYGAAKPSEEVLGRTSAAIGVACEKSGQAFGAEFGGVSGGRKLSQEGEGDRGVYVPENDGGTRPEALKKRAELVGQSRAVRDEIIATPHERAKRAALVGEGSQGVEPVAIGAQEIREEVRVPGITLASSSGVPRPGGLYGVGMNGNDRMAGLDERVDQGPGRSLDSDGKGRGSSQAPQLGEHFGQSRGAVCSLKAAVDASGLVDHADRMFLQRPVDACKKAHVRPPEKRVNVPAGRSCRSLTVWRSGLLRRRALHPVAGRGLPSPPTARVSSGPFAGKHTWLSLGERATYRVHQ